MPKNSTKIQVAPTVEEAAAVVDAEHLNSFSLGVPLTGTKNHVTSMDVSSIHIASTANMNDGIMQPPEQSTVKRTSNSHQSRRMTTDNAGNVSLRRSTRTSMQLTLVQPRASSSRRATTNPNENAENIQNQPSLRRSERLSIQPKNNATAQRPALQDIAARTTNRPAEPTKKPKKMTIDYGKCPKSCSTFK